MVKNKVHNKNIKKDNIFQVHGYNNCLSLLKKNIIGNKYIEFFLKTIISIPGLRGLNE